MSIRTTQKQTAPHWRGLAWSGPVAARPPRAQPPRDATSTGSPWTTIVDRPDRTVTSERTWEPEGQGARRRPHPTATRLYFGFRSVGDPITSLTDLTGTPAVELVRIRYASALRVRSFKFHHRSRSSPRGGGRRPSRVEDTQKKDVRVCLVQRVLI